MKAKLSVIALASHVFAKSRQATSTDNTVTFSQIHGEWVSSDSDCQLFANRAQSTLLKCDGEGDVNLSFDWETSAFQMWEGKGEESVFKAVLKGDTLKLTSGGRTLSFEKRDSKRDNDYLDIKKSKAERPSTVSFDQLHGEWVSEFDEPDCQLFANRQSSSFLKCGKKEINLSFNDGVFEEWDKKSTYTAELKGEKLQLTNNGKTITFRSRSSKRDNDDLDIKTPKKDSTSKESSLRRKETVAQPTTPTTITGSWTSKDKKCTLLTRRSGSLFLSCGRDEMEYKPIIDNKTGAITLKPKGVEDGGPTVLDTVLNVELDDDEMVLSGRKDGEKFTIELERDVDGL